MLSDRVTDLKPFALIRSKSAMNLSNWTVCAQVRDQPGVAVTFSHRRGVEALMLSRTLVRFVHSKEVLQQFVAFVDKDAPSDAQTLDRVSSTLQSVHTFLERR
jgi:hypothetical protein